MTKQVLSIIIFALMMTMTSCNQQVNQSRETRPRGVEQAWALWTEADGTEAEFEAFVQENLCQTDSERLALFESLSRILEQVYQSADMLTVELLKPTQLTNAAEPATPDWIMSAYSPLAHFQDDMFANKLAFLTIINFPHYSLDEKNTLGRTWTRQEWAFARMGDVFTTRVPAAVNTQLAKAFADAENYIADYNIYMGSLRTEDGRQLWPEDKVLLSHWNLRDELKACYADAETGQEKQEMIYKVMQRIVRQEIPALFQRPTTNSQRPTFRSLILATSVSWLRLTLCLSRISIVLPRRLVSSVISRKG